MDKFRKWAGIIPSLLLCLVAVRQIYLSRTNNLTPWKGGGFGMFSTVDEVNARFFKIYLKTGDAEMPVLAPSQFETDIQRACSYPTDYNINKFLDRLAKTTWVSDEVTGSRDGNAFRFVRPLSAEGRELLSSKVVKVDSVKVQLWRYRFESETRTLSSEKIVERVGTASRGTTDGTK